MNGKDKCSILKQIRCKIARENNIPYHTTECKFEGECRGTCPKCEAELKYITSELEKIKKAGKQVAVAGIAAAMLATSAGGCARKPEREQIITPAADGDMQNDASCETDNDTQENIKSDGGYTIEGEYADGEYFMHNIEENENENIPTEDEIDIREEEPTSYIEIDGDIAITDYQTDDFEGIVFPNESITGDIGRPEEELVTNPNDDTQLPDIPTLEDATQMTSEQLEPLLLGLKRDDIRKIWGAQAPVQQPSTNIIENFDEYWMGTVVLHLFFDDEHFITKVGIFYDNDSFHNVIIPS